MQLNEEEGPVPAKGFIGQRHSVGHNYFILSMGKGGIVSFTPLFVFFMHAFGLHKFCYLHMNINVFNPNDTDIQKPIQKTEFPLTTVFFTNAIDYI